MKTPPWLSAFLLLLSYTAFGGFLHHRGSSELTWLLALLLTAVEASVFSIAWKSARDLLLMGFYSDVGYAAMALIGASLAVVILAWIQISAYFLVMAAAGLLMRVDLLTRSISNLQSFFIIWLISLAGLGLTWLPRLVLTGNEIL